MENKHISYFRVKNFKRFKDLEMKDIGQFNLVLGDNNVGKTSMMEALMVDENLNAFIQSLDHRLQKRAIGSKITDGIIGAYVNSDAKLDSDGVNIEWETNTFSHKLLFEKTLKHAFKQPETKVYYRPSDGVFDLDRFLNDKTNDHEYRVDNRVDLVTMVDFFEPLITCLDRHDTSLTKQYSKLIQSQSRAVKARFIEDLRTIDESILNLDIEYTSSDQPLVTVESSKSNARILLGYYGDGLIGIFRILLFIHLFKGKRLMIDEIDAGIYHSRMKDYWKVILKSAHENSVQIFASTHNKECISCFLEALEELGDNFQKQSRITSLVENPETTVVKAFTYSFQEFEHSLMAGNDIR